MCPVDAAVDTEDTTTLDAAVAETAADSATDVADTLAKCPSDAGCIVRVPIATRSFTAGGATFTICPDGAKPTAETPECMLEIDLGKANWTHYSDTGIGQVTGVVPMRIGWLPVRFNDAMTTAVYALRSMAGLWADQTMQVGVTAPAARPRLGCDTATITATDINSYGVSFNLRAVSGAILVPEFKNGLVPIIISEADKALRDAATAMSCRSL